MPLHLVPRVLGVLGVLSGLACSVAEPGEPADAGTGTGFESGSESDSGWTAGEEEDSETGEPYSLDAELAKLLAEQEVPVEPLEPPPAQDPALVALGEALFFDPILSGNLDVACASCHHPSFALGDGLSLSVGTGALGVGPARAEGEHPPFVPRHAQALFNIGDPGFTRLFWDGRVELDGQGVLRTPAGAELLPGVDGPLAAQAMFPVLDRLEMRGAAGDLRVDGEPNELALLGDDDPQAVWAALMERLGAIPAYVELFAAAYPDASFAELGFAAAANAIAAYEREAFAFTSAPWDAYLAGDLTAISDAAKLGAVLFYGAAGCANCHVGPLLTDHEFHATGVPQLGPGKGASAPFDHGRELITGDPAGRFAFRTPALRNVAISPPYMHDGAHVDLEALLVHYGAPARAIEKLDTSKLHPELADTVQSDPAHIEELVASLSEDLPLEPGFVGLSNLREFLEALTDPTVASLPQLRPDVVPSELPVP